MNMRARLVGAGVAAVLWLPAFLLLAVSLDPMAVALVWAGFIVAPIVGGLLAPRAAASRGLGAGTAIRFALLSVVLGATLWGVFAAVQMRSNPLEGLIFALLGLLFLGIPMLILGVNLSLVWIALLRRILKGPAQS